VLNLQVEVVIFAALLALVLVSPMLCVINMSRLSLSAREGQMIHEHLFLPQKVRKREGKAVLMWLMEGVQELGEVRVLAWIQEGNMKLQCLNVWSGGTRNRTCGSDPKMLLAMPPSAEKAYCM
jgi:hypothetical protein